MEMEFNLHLTMFLLFFILYWINSLLLYKRIQDLFYLFYVNQFTSKSTNKMLFTEIRGNETEKIDHKQVEDRNMQRKISYKLEIQGI